MLREIPWIRSRMKDADPGGIKNTNAEKNPVKTLVKDLLELLCKGFLVYFVIQ